MRELERRAMHAVVRHQQPPRTPTIDPVQAVAGDGLRKLVGEVLRVPQQEATDDRTLVDHTAERVRAHSLRLALDLREDAVRRRLGAEQHGETDQAFMSDRADLDDAALLLQRDHRTDAVAHAVHVGNRYVRLDQDLAEPQADWRQLRNESRLFVARQCAEQPVRLGLM